jgi:hypothetical protein
MSKIIVPSKPTATISTISDYLAEIARWYKINNIQPEGKILSGIWYRGMSAVRIDALQPGVYRDEFTKRAQQVPLEQGLGLETKRLNIECEILREFIMTGAPFVRKSTEIEQYFIAQHFGMPTRLLDWTTNPLAALFFAVENQNNHTIDGEVFIMEVLGIFPDQIPRSNRGVPTYVMNIRDSRLLDLIQECFHCWTPKHVPPLIVPVRPDYQPGRIGQQNSCFTLHMHKSEDCGNATLHRFTVPADAKRNLYKELRQMNINEFTIYNDLDHLSQHIRRAWGITSA